MFDQMIQYWYYTGDKTYNEVVIQGMMHQMSTDKDFMPSNQTLTEVSPYFFNWRLTQLTFTGKR